MPLSQGMSPFPDMSHMTLHYHVNSNELFLAAIDVCVNVAVFTDLRKWQVMVT